MPELLWFLAGAALAGVAAIALRPWWAAGQRPRRQQAKASATVDRPPAAPASAAAEEPRPIERRRRGDFRAELSVDARHLALTLADELANHVSGVSGHAEHLISAAGNPRQLPPAAAALTDAVLRLHSLHGKVLALAGVRTAAAGSTDLAPTITALGTELQRLQIGLEMRWQPVAELPAVAVNPEVVRDVLLFLGCALLRAEHGATQLTVHCERCFADSTPSVQIELALEWTSTASRVLTEAQDASFTLDFEAAFQLVAQSKGELQVKHLRGRSVRAVVRWPAFAAATPVTALPAAAANRDDGTHGAVAADGRHDEAVPAGRHHYGGALVLESDPTVRALLSRELKASGRAVFACSDCAAARTFLQATPDRFELLIVDTSDRLTGDDDLGETIRTTAPDLKVFVLTPGPDLGSETWPNARHLRKPFGVHELRRALASLSSPV